MPLHRCKTPSEYFMRGIKSDKWTCYRCGKTWVWEIRGFSSVGAWRLEVKK